MSKSSFVKVQVRVDWRLTRADTVNTYAAIYLVSEDERYPDTIARHTGRLYEILQTLGACLQSLEISNARVDRI